MVVSVVERKEARINGVSLKIYLEGKKYNLVDWSASGFHLDRFHLPLQTGQIISGKLGSFFGLPRSPLKAVVVWEKDGGAGFAFKQIRSETFAALRERATKG